MMFNSLSKTFDQLKWNAANLWKYVLEQNKSVEFIKNAKFTFGTRIFAAVCGMIATVVTARALGPEGRGGYSVALTLSMLGAYISLLGLNASNTHFAAKRNGFIPYYVSNNLLFSFIIGLLTILLIMIIQFFFPEFILIDNKILLTLSLLWIPLNLVNILSQSLFLGIGNVRKFNIIELIAPAIGMLGIVTLFFLRIINVEVFFFCALLGQMFAAVLGLYYLKPFIKSFLGGLSLKLLKENLLYGLKVLYFPSVFFFMLSGADLLILKYFLGEEQAGYYSVATALSSLLLLLPGAIGTLLFAKLSQTPEEHLKIAYTTKVVKWLAVLMSITLFLSFLLAKFLIVGIFGEVYQPSVSVFIGLIPAIFFAAISITYLNYFSAEGRWIINTCATAFAALMNIILNFKVIPLLGIMGAAYVASLSQAMLLIILILYNFFRRGSYIKHVFIK